jgi:hypothetical protein
VNHGNKQKKCDHLLGLDSYGDKIYESDNEEYAILDYFNFCPECDKKLIDTAKIDNVL